MSTLKEIFDKAQSTGKVEYTYFGGVYISPTPFEQTSLPFNDKEGFGQVFSEPFIKRGYDPSPKFISFDPTNTYNTALAAGIDAIRITKLLSTSARGVTWLTKQVGLQKSNPDLSYKTVVDPNNKQGELENTRLYNITGINTISQVAAVGLGTHITRHGLTPIDGTDYISLNKNDNGEFESRLTTYKTKIQEGKTQLNKYTGGPDSTLGLGNTIINSYTDDFKLNTGVTDKKNILSSDQYMGFKPWSYNEIQNYRENYKNGNLTYKGNGSENKFIQDFRQKNNFPNSDNYPAYNVHSRIGVTTGQDAIGSPNTIDSINILRITPSRTFFGNSVTARKKVEKEDMYLKGYDTGSVNGYYGRDIIKFRIEVLNNNTPTYSGSINTDVLAFRAYLETMSDNFKPSWKEFNYLGRGEPFYVYEKFSRDIQFTFTMFAHSEQEMAILYTKLNYLMSSTTPDYNKNNQMRGNYVYITIGDYIYRQPGVISSLNISDHFTAPWEIALNEPEKEADYEDVEATGQNNAKHYEIPKYLKVQVGFKPIHNFLPRRMYGEAEEGKTLNHTATFVTPNHMLLPSRYNRYLPSPPKPIKTTNQENTLFNQNSTFISPDNLTQNLSPL